MRKRMALVFCDDFKTFTLNSCLTAQSEYYLAKKFATLFLCLGKVFQNFTNQLKIFEDVHTN